MIFEGIFHSDLCSSETVLKNKACSEISLYRRKGMCLFRTIETMDFKQLKLQRVCAINLFGGLKGKTIISNQTVPE